MKQDGITLYEGPLPNGIAQHALYVDVLTVELRLPLRLPSQVPDPDTWTPTENQRQRVYLQTGPAINAELLRQASAINKQRKDDDLQPIRILADWRANRFLLESELSNDTENAPPERQIYATMNVQAIAYALPVREKVPRPGFGARGE